jgi:serine/threonine protein kinase
VAALAETPDEQSDVAAPQGSEIEPESQAVPDQVEDESEDEDGSEAEKDEEAAAAGQDEKPAAAVAPSAAKRPAQAAEPRELAVAGRRLGGRYRLERLVRGFGGPFLPEPELWVGVDELLNRRVGVDLIATEHPLAEQVARAARDAAAVADARFVQVLDAVQDEDLLYIVTEWVPGAEQLQERLADGPLSPPRATRMVRELAEAMVRAHEAEVAHGAMNPATVMITAAGETKLRGLLVEATLSGQEPEAAKPEERYAADVLALGQIWYAALTARWPGTEAEYGLEPAPVSGTELYTPAQIRAAVPKPVDATVCRALGLGEEAAFGTVKELADAIRSLPRMREEVVEPPATPPRSRSGRPAGAAAAPRRAASSTRAQSSPTARTQALSSPRAQSAPSPSTQPDRAEAWSPAAERKPVWRRPGILVAAACAIAALGTLAAFQLSGNPSNNEDTAQGSVGNATPSPSSGGTLALQIPPGTVGHALTISSDSIWDNGPSSGSEASAPNAYNGSSTGWTMTTQLDSNWAESGGGIGLIFNLGGTHTVDQVKFQIAEAGATVQILTAPSSASTSWNKSGITGNGFTLQKTVSGLAADQTISTSFSPASAEYVAIIFTQVQEQGAISSTNTPAGYRDNLLDAQVLGE